MSIEASDGVLRIRQAVPDDAAQILELTRRDFARIDRERFPFVMPTEDEILELNQVIDRSAENPKAAKRYVAFGESGIEAYIKYGLWKYGDAAPFTPGGLARAKLMDVAGKFEKQRGVFTLATAREDGDLVMDPLIDELVKGSKILDLKDAGYTLNAAVMPEDVRMQEFLEERCLHATSLTGLIQIKIGERVVKVCAQLWRGGPNSQD